MILSAPLPSFRVWTKEKTRKYRVTISSHICKKFLISDKIRNFLVDIYQLNPNLGQH